jgi:hypothetical protein
LLTFAFELAGGIDLILNPHSARAAELIGNLLVGLLIIGIARAWELVWDRATGIIASIAVLTGHDPTQMTPPQRPCLPRRSRPVRWQSRTIVGQRRTARSHLHLAGETFKSATVIKGSKARCRWRHSSVNEPPAWRGLAIIEMGTITS